MSTKKKNQNIGPWYDVNELLNLCNRHHNKSTCIYPTKTHYCQKKEGKVNKKYSN